jgi:hypothetical protein
MEKMFTLEEAEMLLPILESLIKRAMDGKQVIEAIDKQFQDLSHRIFLHGGILVDVAEVAKSKAERERALQQIKDAIAEIHATGVQVKDLDIGLLDFPFSAEGKTVLLCWKFGEGHAIGHWHGLEEGYAGRKPISSLKLSTKKPHSPEKPN